MNYTVIQEHVAPYQIEAAEFLAPKARAYLADAPRVGKTRAALLAAKLRGAGTSVARRVLVVCPPAVRTHWVREAAVIGVPYVTVMSYDELRVRGVEYRKAMLCRHEYEVLITDEHHFLKEATSQRTKLILGKDGYSRLFPVHWALSGTPMPKHPGNLWTTLVAMFPEIPKRLRVATQDDFENRYALVRYVPRRTRYGSQLVRKVAGWAPGAAEMLKGELADVMLRRTHDEVNPGAHKLEWRPLVLNGETPAALRSADAKFAVLDAQREHGLASLESFEKDPLVAVHRRELGYIKAQVFARHLVEQLEATQEPTAVFAYHRDTLQVLETSLLDAGFSVARIDGSTVHNDRVRAMDAFQQGEVDVFLGQNVACMTGITLDRARVAYLVEPQWTAVDNVQLGNRIMNTRDGVARMAVMVTLADTLDEAIIGTNVREARDQQALLG